MAGGDEWVCVRMGDGFESARVTSINVASAFVHFSSFVIHLRREKRTTTSLLFIRVRYILWKTVFFYRYLYNMFSIMLIIKMHFTLLLLLLRDIILDYIFDRISFLHRRSSLRSHVYRD